MATEQKIYELATNAAKYARCSWEKVFPGDQLPSMLELIFVLADRPQYVVRELREAACFLQGVAYILPEPDKREAIWSAVEVLELAAENVEGDA